MLEINVNSTYADVQTVVNEGVKIAENGLVKSAGTDVQRERRKEALKGLRVTLGRVGSDDIHRIGISFEIENGKNSLRAIPKVAVIYKKDGGYMRIVNVDRIPVEWLKVYADTKALMQEWMDGKITAFNDAWPRGFVADNDDNSEATDSTD